jgi:hypothetical protein
MYGRKLCGENVRLPFVLNTMVRNFTKSENVSEITEMDVSMRIIYKSEWITVKKICYMFKVGNTFLALPFSPELVIPSLIRGDKIEIRENKFH